MDTLPKTQTRLKNAPSISDILCRSFLSTAVSSSHCVRPNLKCDRLCSYRQKQTSEHHTELHSDPARIFITQSAHAATYRDVTAAVSGTSVSARPGVFLSLSLLYLHGKWHHFLSKVLLPYVATRIFADASCSQLATCFGFLLKQSGCAIIKT